MSVVLVDSGGANIGSVRYALQRLGVEAALTADPETIRKADRVILPGVGTAAPAMARLREAGLVEVLRGLTQPVLGVCLGMQLLCTHSDEGDVDGLGVIDAAVRRLRGGDGLRVPHMGWNQVRGMMPHPLCAGDAGNGWAYFVHGYAVPVCAATLATCEHGQTFSAAIGRANFMGVQYHPERSAALGMAVLRNFLAWRWRTLA
jgi:glutamine amidotransferase